MSSWQIETMGHVYTTIKIRNPLTKSKIVEIDAKVDNGATMLVLPGSIAKELNFPKIRKQVVKYLPCGISSIQQGANEEIAEKQVIWGFELEICNRKGIFEAVIEPKKTYPLIGAIVMETLDLIIEPRSLKIYPNPRSKLPMAEIE